MPARESLAKRNHRDGYLWDHICADQCSPTEDSAVEQARRCFARSGVDDFDRGDDPGVRPALMWKVLALATTSAGNLTIVASVANMIVVESAREHIHVGFWDYTCFGIPITILTTFGGSSFCSCCTENLPLLVTNAAAARLCGEGIATSSIDANHC
jgi:hypothetical protein